MKKHCTLFILLLTFSSYFNFIVTRDGKKVEDAKLALKKFALTTDSFLSCNNNRQEELQLACQALKKLSSDLLNIIEILLKKSCSVESLYYGEEDDYEREFEEQEEKYKKEGLLEEEEDDYDCYENWERISCKGNKCNDGDLDPEDDDYEYGMDKFRERKRKEKDLDSICAKLAESLKEATKNMSP